MVISEAMFAKTPTGVEEVQKRTHGLGPRIRQMLIMVDGKRDVSALMAIFPPDMVPAMLAQLTEGGFVRQVQQVQATTSYARAVAASLPMVTPVSVPAVLGGAEEDPFALGQMFMINLAKRILGIAGDPIIARLRATHDVDSLRGLYLEWRSTIKQAPDGLFRLKEIEKKLSKVLGQLPTP